MFSDPITLRPHHILCIAHFVGRGYDAPFTANMTRVIDYLHKENPPVKLVLGADIICSACPHNHAGICTHTKKVALYDTRCLSLCGLSADDTLDWRQLQDTARRSILDAGLLCRVCDGCGWFELCQGVHRKCL